MDMLTRMVKNKRLIKYFAMAVTIVLLELTSFQIIFWLTNNAYLSTVLSFVLAVILNWIGSRLLVFGASNHHPAKEFSMVFIASVVGLGIQLAVVFVCVDVLLLYPLIGKVLSIGFSFFWNYWFRAQIIYKIAK